MDVCSFTEMYNTLAFHSYVVNMKLISNICDLNKNYYLYISATVLHDICSYVIGKILPGFLTMSNILL